MTDIEEITYEVKLPSGLCGAVREPNVSDISILTGRKNRKGADRLKDPMAGFFDSIWLETIDPGPYKWPRCDVIGSNGKVNWSGALQGDTSFLFLELRRLAFGDDFGFIRPCPNPMCSNDHIEKWISLPALFNEISGLSERAKEKLEKEGTEALFEAMLPKRKMTIGWKLLTRNDQWQVDQLIAREGDDPDIVNPFSILVRVKHIPGIGDPGGRHQFARKMSLADVDYLRMEYEEHDITIPDRVRIKCPECRNTYLVPIPLDQDFFSWNSAKRPENKPTGTEESCIT